MSGQAKGTGGKKNMMPILIGVVLLVVGLIIGKSVLGGAKPAKDKDKAKVEVGIKLALDEFLVNLEGNGDHYLRTTITLGLKKGLSEEEAKEHVAPMRDAVLSVLSTKTLAELSKAKNKEAMKDEIKKKINDSIGDEVVMKVYLTAFATQ